MKTTPVLSAAGREATVIDNQLLDTLLTSFTKTTAEGRVIDRIQAVEDKIKDVRRMLETHDITPVEARDQFNDIIVGEFLSEQLMQAATDHYIKIQNQAPVAIH